MIADHSVIFPEAGHVTNIEQPEEFEKELRGSSGNERGTHTLRPEVGNRNESRRYGNKEDNHLSA